MTLQGDLSGDLYVLRPGSHIPADGDLRKLLTPDMWCAHESMAAGQARLKETGLKHIAQLAQVHPDYLRLAYEQLPPSPVTVSLWQSPSSLLVLSAAQYCQPERWSFLCP